MFSAATAVPEDVSYECGMKVYLFLVIMLFVHDLGTREFRQAMCECLFCVLYLGHGIALGSLPDDANCGSTSRGGCVVGRVGKRAPHVSRCRY